MFHAALGVICFCVLYPNYFFSVYIAIPVHFFGTIFVNSGSKNVPVHNAVMIIFVSILVYGYHFKAIYNNYKSQIELFIGK